MTSTRLYEFFKNKYETIKPIRGRSVEVRPLGRRTRDWETITEKKLLSGEASYCAKLWRTECVEYFANGDITLRTDGWDTPSTAEFIHEHSPFYCGKQYNRLWIKLKTSPDAEPFAYPVGNELQLRYVAEGCYEPINKVLINKRVVDRQKAKDARAPVMPFLAWAKVFLTMSGGWLMHETRKEVVGISEGRYAYYKDSDVYSLLADPACSDGDYLPILLSVLRDQRDAVCRRLKDTSNAYDYDLQFDYEFLKKKMLKIADSCVDIYKIVEVEPSSKPIHNTVR